MSGFRAIAREGNANIPSRSHVTIELAYSRDGQTGVCTMYTNFPVEPLIRYSKSCRRALVDQDQDTLTLDCGEMRVPISCYDQVIRWLADLHFYWPEKQIVSRQYPWPSNAPASGLNTVRKVDVHVPPPRLSWGNIHTLYEAIGLYEAVRAFDIVSEIRQPWIRNTIIDHIRQNSLRPEEVRVLWTVFKRTDRELVDIALDGVATRWNRDNLNPGDIFHLYHIRKNDQELWTNLDERVGKHETSVTLSYLESLLAQDGDLRQDGPTSTPASPTDEEPEDESDLDEDATEMELNGDDVDEDLSRLGSNLGLYEIEDGLGETF